MTKTLFPVSSQYSSDIYNFLAVLEFLTWSAEALGGGV